MIVCESKKETPKSHCVLKTIELRALKVLNLWTILDAILSQHNWRGQYDHLEKEENLQFDNHMSSEN
jgi:hypothetical protein